jgi:hypothetical protein
MEFDRADMVNQTPLFFINNVRRIIYENRRIRSV